MVDATIGNGNRVARGEHPMRTPVYGVALIVAAMLVATLVGYWTHPPDAVRDVVWVLCLVAWIVGAVLSLRDLTPPRRR